MKEFHVWALESGQHVYDYNSGVVTLYEESFMAGLRLLIHPLIKDVFNKYRVVPSQLGPNSIWAMTCFVNLCHLAHVAPCLSLF